MQAKSADIFLSYKAEDRARVAPLVDALCAEGFNVWWDQHITGGSNWRRDIEENLNAARCVIVAWSKRSVGPEGEFVRDEASRARTNGRYFPIKIDQVIPPLGFGETQALDLVGWKGRRDDPRFQALVATVRARLSGEASSEGVASASKASLVTRRATLIGAGAAGVLALGATGYWVSKGGSLAAAKRIVVLPFTNMSGDSEQGYFADGLTEELRGSLSRAGIEVIGRVSSEAVAGKDAAAIVDQLNVSHILTGSVRKSPKTMRISAQLVEGSAGVEQWAQTYDREPGDAIAIQTDIAKEVATALSVALGVISKAIELGGTSNAQAQDYLFRAEELIKNTGYADEAVGQEAISLIEAALAEDSQYALAWFRLAIGKMAQTEFAQSESASQRLMAEAERHMQRGITIAPSFGFGHSVIATFAAYVLNLPSSLREMRAAIRLAPNDSSLLRQIGVYLPWIGNIDEAEKVGKQCVSLDPQNASAYIPLSTTYYVAGRYDEAITELSRALNISTELTTAKLWLALAHIEKGEMDVALRAAQATPQGYWARLAIEGVIAARRGQTARAKELIAALEEDGGDLNSYQYAQIHAQSGNQNLAFKALGIAERSSDPGLMYLMRDPLMKPLHSDPRFAAMVNRLNFPVLDPGFASAV